MSTSHTNGGPHAAHDPAHTSIDSYENVADETPREAKAPRMKAAPDYSGPAKRGDKGLITVQPLRQTEMQPSYAQDLGTSQITHGVYGTFISGLGVLVGFCGAIPVCPMPNPFKNVQQGSVGLVSRFGQFYKSVDPGLVYVNVCSEGIRVVDVKIQMTQVPRQSVMTKDNVSVDIDSVICWHVVSPYRAAYGINDVRGALIERAQTCMRQVVGGRVLQTIVTDREGLAAEIQEIVEVTAEKWGVSIESILLKDVTFSIELQQSLSSAATQKRIGESKIISAKADVDAARLMRQAADILASPAAMQIRQLEALQNMARTANSKVVFVPMNLGGMGNQAAGSAMQQQIAASHVDPLGPSSHGELHELQANPYVGGQAGGGEGMQVNDPNEMVVSLGGAARSAGLMNSMAGV